MPPVYLADASVDDGLDRELRALLSLCFTGPQDVVFRDRRYFKEPPRHRWIVRDDAGRLVAHVAVHEKMIEVGVRGRPIGGIAEVCVHPDHRGRGHVRAMLSDIHAWLAAREIPYAVLFGDPRVYASSGYIPAPNLMVLSETTGTWEASSHAMARPLLADSWPAGAVRLIGPGF